jgi:hypothetical protein
MSYSQYGGGYEEEQFGYEGQQRQPPSGYGNPARPMVDPEAEGEVDLEA